MGNGMWVSKTAAVLADQNSAADFFIKHFSACLKFLIRFQSSDKVDFGSFCQLHCCFSEGWNFGISYSTIFGAVTPPVSGFDIRVISVSENMLGSILST